MAKTNYEKIFAVIGLGNFGYQICETLAQQGGEVIAVDNRSEVVERIKNIVSQAILVDTTDPESISSLPLNDVDVAIIGIGENIEANILTTALLKQYNIPRIIARAVTPIHERVLRQIGAHEIINIEINEGKRIAQKLIAPEILDQVPLSESDSVAEVFVPDNFVDKDLKSLDLRNKMNINVIALKRKHRKVDEAGNPESSEELIFPAGDDVLQGDDILILVGRNKDITNFTRVKRGK
ncbi:MAG: TrkA family potassium uptake protein [Spirochaetales bacterium]|nr:TrkA family potassium uptake protein [Spirochaetales bacterium]MCF7937973.1 TrkA family potassium uptake protein [Spirochaetales bacterium]